MKDNCPMCQTWRSKGALYCGSCGAYLRTRLKEYPILHLVPMIAAAVVTFIILCNTVYCLVNYGQIADDLAGYRFGVSLTYGFGSILLFYFDCNTAKYVLLAILVIDVLFLAYAVRRFVSAYRKEMEDSDPDHTEKCGLCASSSALCASLFLGVILLLFSAMTGNGADSSWMSDYPDGVLTFMLTRAGIREELMCRVFWIGLPMAALALIINKDRRSWQYLMGGFGMSRTVAVLILFSSLLFGLAHLDGWGWGKVPDAVLGGIIFGYIYSEYGLYAAVLAHTANDTMESVGYLFGVGTESLMTLLMLGLGLATVVYWILKPNREVFDLKNMKTFPGRLETGLLGQWGRH